MRNCTDWWITAKIHQRAAVPTPHEVFSPLRASLLTPPSLSKPASSGNNASLRWGIICVVIPQIRQSVQNQAKLYNSEIVTFPSTAHHDPGLSKIWRWHDGNDDVSFRLIMWCVENSNGQILLLLGFCASSKIHTKLYKIPKLYKIVQIENY